MDSATEEIYFQKLQELIQDEDKIVTISSVAADFKVSVRNSRKLLEKYVKDVRKLKPNELAVTYVLAGQLKDTKEKAVLMVREDDLLEKQQLFDVKPTQVIYSIQKNKHVDFNIIALIDMFDSTKIREKPLIGSIVSKNCTKRILKLKKLPPPPAPTLKGKSSFFVPKSEKPETSKSTETSEVESKPKTSNSIATLFKGITPSASKTNQKNSVSPKAKPSSQKSNALTGFLQNGSSKPVKTQSNDSSLKKKIKNENGNNLKTEHENIVKNDEVLNMDVDSNEEIFNKKANNSIKKEEKKKEEKKKKSKRQRDKSQEMPSKRRKRIVERIDSDSDDLFEKDSEDSEDIIEKSDDEPERVPSPVMKKELAPKNKRRKSVTKTFQDEEGFIVTKTEYVYETASEDENAEPSPPAEKKQQDKPIIAKKTEAKKVPAKNQTTLMNFFKKK